MKGRVLFSHRVTREEDGQMLQQVLKRHFPFSRTLIRKYKQKQLITVNRAFRYFTARVHSGDWIEIFSGPSSTNGMIREPMDLAIVYEDQDLIVLDKPPGVVVHPTRGYVTGTIANGLAHYFLEKNECSSIHPINRLDKDTSGLMVVAKHPFAHSFLAREFTKKQYQRFYLAIVSGMIYNDQGTINAPIGLEQGSSIRRVISNEEGGKPATTHYVVCERLNQATLVKLQLETGRTHQIRVHMASIGHPLRGDHLYGDPHDSFPRQALHACEVKLFHPRQKKWVQWTSFFPKDIMKLYHELRMID